MTTLDRGESLYYARCSRKDSSIGYPRLPEPTTYQVHPVSSGTSESCHADNVSNEGKTAAATILTVPPRIHPTPPPSYQPELRESPRNLTRLEPLRFEYPSTPYTSEYIEESRERQKFAFWRKKKGIILIVVLSNLIIICIMFGEVLVSRDVASPSTSKTEMVTATEGYRSSTTTSLASTILPATTMSTSPYQWAPNSDGIQASGNVKDSGNSQNNADAAGKSEGFSGPYHSPKGGKQ